MAKSLQFLPISSFLPTRSPTGNLAAARQWRRSRERAFEFGRWLRQVAALLAVIAAVVSFHPVIEGQIE
jgi:hypothetical protein